MSDTLVVFAEPLIEVLADPADLESCRGALTLASLVWNGLTLLEREGEEAESLGAETIEQVENTLIDLGLAKDEVADLIDALAERKETLFPDEIRLIIGVDAQRRGDRMFVHAASTYE